jgi:mRNA-degrading endonuclease YafQ of YafQ-DinJ toxin-antitoxin module
MFYRKVSGKFKKDYKLCKKRNYDMVLLTHTINLLEETGALPESYCRIL